MNWWHSDTVRTYQGSYQGLFVSPNDWALQGQPITFHIGESQAEETARYDGNKIQLQRLNLTFP